MILLGIDQGTTGTRAVVYGEDLRPVADAYRPIKQHHPRPGWVEHDPEELFRSVVESVAEVLGKAGVRRVDAVGLDNQGETVVAWEASTGRPLHRAIVWQDRRTEPILVRLRGEDAEEEILEFSGLPLDPYFSSSKITWLLEHVPEVAEAARRGDLRVGTTDAFFRHRLAGTSATDPSTASRTQLMGIRERRWDERLLKRFGVAEEALPDIRSTAGDLGVLRHPDWEVELPLGASVVDQQAALAGQGCFSAGDAKCTYGTGCFMLTNAGPEPPRPGTGLLPTVAWVLGERADYALDGGVFTAGSCVEWLVSLGLLASAANTDRQAGSVEDAAGVRFLPALSGIGAPWWRSEARGVWAGLTAAAGPPHLVRAVLEGIAFRVRDIVEAAGASGARPTRLRVDGGLTRSETLMRFQADVLGIPVERSTDPELTSLGAALLAALGRGLAHRPEDLTVRLAPPEVVEPGRDQDWREEAYAGWRAFLEGAAELR